MFIVPNYERNLVCGVVILGIGNNKHRNMADTKP